MLEKHRHVLIKFRKEIAQDLLVDDVLVFLRSKFVLDSDDTEVIRVEKTSHRQAEKLLDILPQKGFEAFDHFFSALSDKYPHLAKLLQNDSNEEQQFNFILETVDSPLQLEMMSEEHKDILNASRVEIVEDLLVDDVLNFLRSKMVFDLDDTELIRAEKTSRRQAEKLLDLLETKSDAAFYNFRDSLEEPYPHLVELLQDNLRKPRAVSDVRELTERVENVLLEGGVPQRPTVFANRARDLHKIHTALRSLKERDSWVILHGMAGCGKTVMGSEALRSPALLEECFPGGVHWVRIGPVDQSKLLMRMQNLCARLDSDHSRQPPRNTEEAKDRLRMLFAHQHPRSLLVLDDLWHSSDIKYFDIRCRIMVTTRDAAIANMVGGSKAKVHISEGFTENESLQILAQWTKQTVNHLPGEATEIFHLTNGSPLAISMVGALLRDHPKRWQYYVSQLKKKNVSKLKPKFEYEYPTLTEAIRMSINNLHDDLRELYEDFAVFDEESKVPAQVLCILWDEEFEVVEDWMEDLVNKSLARRTVKSEDALDTFYSIHNLQLTYLQEQAPNLEALHKKLVNKYRKLYKGLFSEMIDDGYIHWNLLRHMLKAGLVDMAEKLVTDLRWLAAKLRITGPADLLNDYMSIKGVVDNKTLKVIEDFHHFVSVNAHRFVEKPLPDVIQMALSESLDSEVYKQAQVQAMQLAAEDNFYLDWSNQTEETQETLLITVKIHQGAVYCCHFSQDASKVVSCGADKTVKVWESHSGKELLSMTGHTDVVYCCNFSSDDGRIVSCSADHTVKIWDCSVSGRELLNFKGHNQDVFTCMFSPDDSNVVSCSADKTVKVWNSGTGVVMVTFTGHADIVRCCCYAPDGSRIVSCSDDTLVKVWDSLSGQELFSLEGGTNSAMTYCCFKPTGCSIIGVSDTSVKIWDSTTGQDLKSLQTPSTTLALAYSQDDSILALGLSDTTVQLWNAVSEASLGAYRGHSGWVHCVAFSQDACKLVSASDDETVKIWTVDKTTVQGSIKLRMVFDVLFLDGSLIIAITDACNRLMIYEGENTKFLAQSEPHACKITSISFNTDGRQVSIGLDDGSVKILETSSCTFIQEFHDHSGRVKWCAFSKCGQVLVSVSDDSTAKVYSCVEARLLFSLEGHTSSVQRCMFFNKDHRRLLTSSLDGSLRVWDTRTGCLQFSCKHSSSEYILSCDVSQDHSKLLSGSVDRYAKVWDANSGALCFSLGPHPDCVRSASFSKDNKFICTGCDDGTVRVWNVADGRELAVCSKHDGWVSSCWFSSDSGFLVSVSNNIKWWKRDGTLCQQFNLKGVQAKSILFSPDFKTFVTVDNVGMIYVLKKISPMI